MADLYNYVDRDSVRIVLKNLSDRQDAVSQQFAAALKASLPVWEHRPERKATSSPVELLGQTVRMAGLVDIVEHRGNKAYAMTMFAWSRAFMARILRNLRDIICGPRRGHGKLGDKSKAVLAALGGFIAHEFHLESTTAAAIAALVLMALGKATKKAFCEMTDEEVLEAFTKP